MPIIESIKRIVSDVGSLYIKKICRRYISRIRLLTKWFPKPRIIDVKFSYIQLLFKHEYIILFKKKIVFFPHIFVLTTECWSHHGIAFKLHHCLALKNNVSIKICSSCCTVLCSIHKQISVLLHSRESASYQCVLSRKRAR